MWTSILCIAAAWAKAPTLTPGVLVQGGVNRGGANGLAVDTNGNLLIANVFGNGITVIDPDSGKVLDRLGPAEGVIVPDDIALGSDGSLWFTNPALGTVSRRSPGPDGIGTAGGETTVVTEGFLRANPITVSDDDRVFFGQCFAESTGVYEITATGPLPLVTDVPGCAANGMDVADGVLYTPRWFESRILGLSVDGGDVLYEVRTPTIPSAVKVHDGTLYWVSQDAGKVFRTVLPDLDAPHDELNETGLLPPEARPVVEIVATLAAGLDNLVFDITGRLFVSNAVSGAVDEVLPGGEVRSLVAGGMVVPMGITWLDGAVVVGEPQSVRAFDATTGETRSVVSSTFGVGDLTLVTGVHPSPTPGHVTVSSWVTGQIQRVDPKTGAVAATTTLPGGPAAALPVGADLWVAQPIDGTITRLSGPALANPEVVAALPGAAGLASVGDQLFATSVTEGTVVRLSATGKASVLASGLSQPEGLVAIDGGRWLAVVEAGAGRVTFVSTRSGKTRPGPSGFVFEPNPPGFGAYWFNGITAGPTGELFINADGANQIVRLTP